MCLTSLLSSVLGFSLTGIFISFFSLTDVKLVNFFLNSTHVSEGRDSHSQLVSHSRVVYTDLK